MAIPLHIGAAMFKLRRFLEPVPPQVDRRRAPRFECGRLRATMNSNAAALLVNISRCGALVHTPTPQPLRAPVTLWVEVAERVVEFRGEVVRCSTPRERTPMVEIAVEFLAPQTTATQRQPFGHQRWEIV